MNTKKVTGIILAGCMALVSAANVNAQEASNKTGYEGEMVDGKKEGRGTYYFENGNWLEGRWYNDVQWGKTTIYYQDGKKTDGFYHNGALEGAVCVEAPYNRFYKGMYRGGTQHGLGVITNENNRITKAGIWEDDEKTDTELLMWSDKEVVYYAEDKAELNGGKAIACYSNDVIYIGEFVDGKREGKGVYYYPNGEWTEVTTQNNMLNGQGVECFVPEEGEDVYLQYISAFWKDDKKCGAGVYYYSDGSCIVGNLENDKRQGLAVRIHADGTIEAVAYEDGKLSDHALASWEDEEGNRYAGEKDGDWINGTGLYITAQQDGIYIGNFVNGVCEGRGVYYWPHEDILYDGEWKAGAMSGSGRSVFYGGCYYYVGQYEKNDWDGAGICVQSVNEWCEGVYKNGKIDSGSYVTISKRDGADVVIYQDGEKIQDDTGVILYKNSNFYGPYAAFGPGEYAAFDLAKRGLAVQNVSSIEVPDGYSITVNCKINESETAEYTYTEDVELAGTIQNDSIVSFRVKREKKGE